MICIQSQNLKPGMVLARDLLGQHNELLLARGETLSAALVAKLKSLDHKDAYIVDEMDDMPDEVGLISLHLKRSTAGAVRSLFTQIEAGNVEGQLHSLAEMRHYLDEIIDEISANGSMLTNLSDIKAHDEYTYYHSVSVAALSVLLGMGWGMNRAALYRLGMGALLHDIGKVFIPKELLLKPGALSADEFQRMKAHSAMGYAFLREQWGGPAESVVAVLTHHERFNGSGYPLGLAGDKQPLVGKIIALADVYDAMTSDRVYHSAYTPSDVVEHIMGNSGILFDPQVVSTFIRKVVPYPIGSKVRLSNGRRAIVVENNLDGPIRPKVKLLHQRPGEVAVSDATLDLLNDPTLWSVTIIGVDK